MTQTIMEKEALQASAVIKHQLINNVEILPLIFTSRIKQSIQYAINNT